MTDLSLYILQRASALVMAPLVVGHIVVMIIAVQGGLSAEEILGRTSGSVGWALFYGAFVVAASIHAAIGLRTVIGETFNVGARAVDLSAVVIGVGLLALGLRAVYAVVAA